MSTPQQPPGQEGRFEPRPGQDYIKLSPAHDFLKSTEEDLLAKADECLSRAGSALDQPPSDIDSITHTPKYDDFSQLRLFLEAQSCLGEVLRRRASQTAEEDRKREHRRFLTELLVIGGLIVVEIVLSVLGFREGRQQATILKQMNKNTEDAALQIQRAADATTASLEILRQERAERAKKPSPALYVGNIPIDKAKVRPTIPNGPSQSIARFDLLLKNEGDAPLSTSEIHALVPEDINIYLSPLPSLPEYEEPSKPGTRTVSYAVPLTPVGKSLRVDCQILVPKGHATFKATFTITTPQLQAVTPLGSLTVLPPKP